MTSLEDTNLQISFAQCRTTRNLTEKTFTGPEFFKLLSNALESEETQEEYFKLPKSKQDELKDRGGFVGGRLKNGKRKTDCVVSRCLITLDMDNIPENGTSKVIERINGLQCCYCLYSTRKHTPAAPRLRVVIPMDREATPEEYEAAARKIAYKIQPELTWFDPTTFQPSRLMYFPTISKGAEFIYTADTNSPLLSVEGVLSEYSNWADVSQWHQHPQESAEIRKKRRNQQDPTTKSGVVGAFCRVYSIPEVIEAELSDIYAPCGERYTYIPGTTSGGAVLYDNDSFLYSHHATDPAGGRLCNAFDLVRLHRYATLDTDVKPGTPTNRLPSYKAMCDHAIADKLVQEQIQADRLTEAAAEFESVTGADTAAIDLSWIANLENTENGKPRNNARNISIIFNNDPLLKNKIAWDAFNNRIAVLGELPWDRLKNETAWTDSDDSGLRVYFDKTYGITSRQKIDDGLKQVVQHNSFDPVTSYFDGLQWDGIKRLDTLFIDYLGAENNDYTRAVTRRVFTAIVARNYRPGLKFDYVPILTGKQGQGKSTILNKMGRGEWFTDRITTFDGKEYCELLSGKIIAEIAELDAMNRTDINRLKSVITATADEYRPAYGKHVVHRKRRAVFFGTTNHADYLRDTTGNRRFLPIDTGIIPPTKNIFTDLTEYEIGQIWAEAKQAYLNGEPLYLDNATLTAAAEEQQEVHRAADEMEDEVRQYLNTKFPLNWIELDQVSRGAFLAFPKDKDTEPLAKPNMIKGLQIWVDVMNGSTKNYDWRAQKRVGGIMRCLGWKRTRQRVSGKPSRVYIKDEIEENVSLLDSQPTTTLNQL